MFDPQIHGVFEQVLDILVAVSPLSQLGRSPSISYNKRYGVLRARICYPYGCQLTIHLAASLLRGYPEWVYYSFHFKTSTDQVIFRYDNARYHATLSNFPHHKHIDPQGDVEASTQPTVHQIAREIAEYLERQ